MTYTFKLARRLAVSRTYGMLPAILLFAACSGDVTAPENSSNPLGPQDDWRPRTAIPVTVSVNPSSVTVETNQLIRFLAYGRNSDGDSVFAPISWQATGGTILPDGRFSSAAVGSFMITATTRTRGEAVVDSSTVKVVRRRINLKSVQISPEAATLAPGVSQTFSITGRLADGRAVAIGAVWTATGGTIDAGGNYVAGDTAGTYQVIASNTAMTLADTAIVTITAPPTPPAPTSPPPPPPDTTPESPPPDTTPESPPPAPTLASVTLLPATATLAPSATRQFTAYGRTSVGDSVAVSVTFTATGGSITAGGLYTAGSTAGSYRVVASSSGLADTATITVTTPLGSGPAAGIPLGLFAAWDGYSLKANTQSFTLTIGAVTASTIATQIAEARSNNVKLILAMTGGSHSNYLSIIDGVLQFDYSKWKAKMDTYNTAAIRDAVAKGVADGTIAGNYVMDEPNVTGGGDGNTWGPAGTMTKVRVDGLCSYVKSMFPTLAVGVAHNHNVFEPEKSYQVCEFLIDQYATRKGDVTQFRDDGLALGRRDGMAIVFSLNILNGGVQDRDGIWDCTGAGQGGKGQWEPLCRMTADQVRNYGLVLGPAGCALTLWRYDDVFMATAANQRAFSDLRTGLAGLPAKSCRGS